MVLRPKPGDLKDSEIFIHENGVIEATDSDGMNHFWHTKESWRNLEDAIAALDRMAAAKGYAHRFEMFKELGRDAVEAEIAEYYEDST
jgi:hypothetical protein